MFHTAFPHAHRHAHADAPQTDGAVIHWAARYDVLVPLATFGGMRRVYQRVADLVEAKPGDAVLDVACGPGDLALVMARRVGASGLAAGIDASPEMIARARQKAQRRGLTVDFRLEPAEALTFADGQFDSVVSSFAYHHFPGDDLKRQALASMARVLKPGGKLCIVDFLPPNDPQPHAPMSSNLQALVDRLGEVGFTDITTGHQLPSLGVVVHLLGIPSAGYVLARRATEPAHRG